MYKKSRFKRFETKIELKDITATWRINIAYIFQHEYISTCSNVKDQYVCTIYMLK